MDHKFKFSVDKPQHIQHFQTCQHGDNGLVGPTGNASCAADCPNGKSDGFLQDRKT